jgi:pimeloyl-ACP methyl ester carboxylesterase
MIMAKMIAKSRYHLIGAVAELANALCKKIYKFDLKEIKPIDLIRNNYVPICFIHGGSDKFIDKINAEMMYKENPGYKELHIFDGAKHAQSYNSDHAKYINVINDFVKKVEKSEGTYGK